MSRLLNFEKLNNIRDLGGEKTLDGRVISPGKLIRCGHLADISEEDIRKLEELTDTIVDFRSEGEHARQPDRVIPGTSSHHLPIVDTQAAGITREAQDVDLFTRMIGHPQQAKEYMCGLYKNFIMSDYSVSRYREFVDLVRENHDKAVLWHCTAGKDRAGMGAVILEEILGVSREEIMEEYLKTNLYLEKDIRFLSGWIKKRAGKDSPEADLSLQYLFGAEKEYIESFYKAIEEKFGGFAEFIREGLKLSDEDVRKIRDRYLTDPDEEKTEEEEKD